MESSVGVIQKEGNKYCIHFSDGRKECKNSMKEARKRENQIKYFKNRDKANSLSGEDLYAMAHLDIYAIHNKDNSDETVFFVSEESSLQAYLVKGSEDTGENEVFKLDADYGKIHQYSDIINEANINFVQAIENKIVKLSEPIIENQLLSGGHTHTIDVSLADFSSSDFQMLETSEVAGHKHFVEITKQGNYYVFPSSLKLGELSLSHEHMIVINMGDA